MQGRGSFTCMPENYRSFLYSKLQPGGKALKKESVMHNGIMKYAARAAAVLLTAVIFAAGGAGSISAKADTLPDAVISADSTGPGANGWVQREDGAWQYMQFGFFTKGKWANIGDRWYWFNAEGVMQTGWKNIDGADYYLSEQTVEGHPLGSCYQNGLTPDGCTVDENGVKIADPAPVPAQPAIDMSRPNPYGISCVEVDITNQTVYCYIGNDLVVATPCVTGNAWAHPTRVGHFRINSKETNRYLQGYNDNGTKYKSWVNFWMPFNGGQGLHDAGWRSSFGGTIYQSGGSHGCVNMPYDAARAIYSVAWVGMPVIVHN